MSWRDRLTPAERAELEAAPPGSLLARLARLLDEQEQRPLVRDTIRQRLPDNVKPLEERQ